MIKTVIADDEPLVRAFLRSNLELAPDVRVVAACADGDEAVAAIHVHAPDVAFLDVQMPGYDGFEVIEAIGPSQMPLVVFVTAFDEYAIRAFEVHAIDYLLKPFSGERVLRAVERVRVRLAERARAHQADHLEKVVQAIRAGRQRTPTLPVRVGDGIELVRVSEIDRVEADSNYVVVHAGARALVMRETLGAIERKLDSTLFVRVHRSHLVNATRVRQLRYLFHGEYELTLTDGSRIGTGRTYSHAVQRLLHSNRPKE